MLPDFLELKDEEDGAEQTAERKAKATENAQTPRGYLHAKAALKTLASPRS